LPATVSAVGDALRRDGVVAVFPEGTHLVRYRGRALPPGHVPGGDRRRRGHRAGHSLVPDYTALDVDYTNLTLHSSALAAVSEEGLGTQLPASGLGLAA
jgi:hypothetical protein